MWRCLPAFLSAVLFLLPARATDSPQEKAPLRAGIIGLDTSHVIAFTSLLNKPKSGKVEVKVVAGFPGGSPDLPASRDRVAKFTKEMQDQWRAMPAQDRTMMSGMMQAMSQTEEAYGAAIKANGVLFVDGANATLTVRKTAKDKSGSSTETTTQKFKVDGDKCLISR